jgi:hypothetical protein
VAQPDLQFGRVEVRVPRAHCAMLVVEHAHEFHGKMADVTHARIDVGPADGAGRRDLEVTEIRLLAGPGVMLRYVQP